MFKSQTITGKQLQANCPNVFVENIKLIQPYNPEMMSGIIDSPIPLVFQRYGNTEEMYLKILELNNRRLEKMFPSAEFPRSGTQKHLSSMMDFLDTSRHEILYTETKKGTKGLAISSSYPASYFVGEQNVLKGRFLSKLYVRKKFLDLPFPHTQAGTLLLKNVEDYARNLDEKAVFLTATDSTKAFFKKCGYIVLSSFNVERVTCHKMFKMLSIGLGVVVGLKALLQQPQSKTPHISV